MGKGDGRRPQGIGNAELARNWARTFERQSRKMQQSGNMQGLNYCILQDLVVASPEAKDGNDDEGAVKN